MVGRKQVIGYVVARAGARILSVLPERVLRRVAPGGRTSSPPTPLEKLVPDAAVRLLVGPANSAGQGWQWARAVERVHPDAGAVAMTVERSDDAYRFTVDQSVPLAAYRWSRSWTRAQRTTIVTRFTHVLAESGRQLLGDTRATPLAELRSIRAAGVAVGLVFHGSDIRSPRRHAASTPWSPFHDAWKLTPSLELRARENARLVTRLGAPSFVTTPDLLDDLPTAHWLPVVVDPGPWIPSRPALSGDVLIVGHAPSSGHLKGTELIEPVLEALHAEGVIDYRRIVGVPASEMPARFSEVDVVLDQFRIGAYGVAAVEAMNAGRAVIARIEPRVRERIRAATGRELPILDADPDTLEAVLRGIAADRSAARAAASAGSDYARAVHGGAMSVGVLEALLGSR
jgi:hypothetical protein